MGHVTGPQLVNAFKALNTDQRLTFCLVSKKKKGRCKESKKSKDKQKEESGRINKEVIKKKAWEIMFG